MNSLLSFSWELFKYSAESANNILLSPISVLHALAIAQNGAKGETSEQINNAIGINKNSLNSLLYRINIDWQEDRNISLHNTNSIWLKKDDKLFIEPQFIEINKRFLQASVYKQDFNEKAVELINQWIQRNTAGRIDKMIDEIPYEAIAYLINALSIDAKWQNIYKVSEVEKLIFHNNDGSTIENDFMFSEENILLQNDICKGFVKYYEGSRYAFAALLPNENVSVMHLIKSLDSVKLKAIFASQKHFTVQAGIPKFKSEFNIELSQILKNMGIKDAFMPDKADFSAMGNYAGGRKNIYIDKLLHKCFISVDEAGTEAGAASVVEMLRIMAFIEPDEKEFITLDRPFVYMIIDTARDNLPLFIGSIIKL